jgi:hypothetical protein
MQRAVQQLFQVPAGPPRMRPSPGAGQPHVGTIDLRPESPSIAPASTPCGKLITADGAMGIYLPASCPRRRPWADGLIGRPGVTRAEADDSHMGCTSAIIGPLLSRRRAGSEEAIGRDGMVRRPIRLDDTSGRSLVNLECVPGHPPVLITFRNLGTGAWD